MKQPPRLEAAGTATAVCLLLLGCGAQAACTQADVHRVCGGVADAQWRGEATTPAGALLVCIHELCPLLGAPVSVCGGAAAPLHQQWGILHDGTEGYGYASGLECARSLQVPAGMTLSLVFIEWGLYDTQDYVFIEDDAWVSGPGHYVASVGGLYMPALYTVTVPSGRASVHFTTDDTLNSTGAPSARSLLLRAPLV